MVKPGHYVLLVQHPKESENANCGGFCSVCCVGIMTMLKVEEVDLKEYWTFEEAKQNIGGLIEEVSNEMILHSNLGYAPPIESEVKYLRKVRC